MYKPQLIYNLYLPGPHENNPIINALKQIRQEVFVLDLHRIMEEQKRRDKERDEIQQKQLKSRRKSEIQPPRVNTLASFIKSKRRPSQQV